MRYIKTYEDIIKYNDDPRKYKVGDYVLISGQMFAAGKDVPVKLIRQFHFDGSGNFEDLHIDGYTGVCDYKYIKRHLTPEEIEDFETKLKVKKYNL
jgi:hypothetical protein